MGPLIIPDESADLNSALLPLLLSGGAHVPGIWRLEVLNLARMAVRKRRLTESQYTRAMTAISGFDVAVDQTTDRQAWTATATLSVAHNLTAYDASYLELALRLGVPLLTRDGPLARAARAETIKLLPS